MIPRMVAVRFPAIVGACLVIAYVTFEWWWKWVIEVRFAEQLIGEALLLLAILWVLIRWRRSAESFSSALRRWMTGLIKGAVVAALLLVILGGGWTARTTWKADRINQEALAQWEKIGRPMRGFEKQFSAGKENESLGELTAALKPLGIFTLYKPSCDARNAASCSLKNQFELPGGVTDLLENLKTDGDTIAIVSQNLDYLDRHRNELTHLYDGILQRPAPVWKRELSDIGPVVAFDFLILRKLSQLIAGDAAYRLDRHPDEAARAIRAGLKITNCFQQEPSMVIACTLRAAIQELYARPIARLEEDPKAWDQLATEYEDLQKQYLKIIQGEAFWISHAIEHSPELRMQFPSRSLLRLPSWTGKYLIPAHARYLTAMNSLSLAAQSDALIRAYGVPTEEEQKRLDDPGNPITPNYLRGATRMARSYLLREQAEMIRFSRARLREGQTRAEHASVVVPGAKWEMTGDSATSSAKIKLTPIPEWAINSPVCDPGFFLLPLDGSRAWDFTPAVTSK